MIHADVHGKLREDGTNAHDRSEDLLTSTVFGLLRYFTARDAMVPLLERGRPVALSASGIVIEQASASRQQWIGLTFAVSFSISFWPSFGSFGQPDLLLTFRDAQNLPVHLVVVEAKLHSPKSGDAASDAGIDAESETEESSWHPDQLVRYWNGLQAIDAGKAPVPRSVVYLTAHATPPVDELAASLRACRTMRLSWLSWRDIWYVIAPLSQQEPPPLAAIDLATLLASRGFKPFEGFKSAVVEIPHTGRFWEGPMWFQQVEAQGLDRSGRYWRTK